MQCARGILAMKVARVNPEALVAYNPTHQKTERGALGVKGIGKRCRCITWKPT
jgi:hypothetical protein